MMSFVNDQYGDATAESIPWRNSILLFIVCAQKDFAQMPLLFIIIKKVMIYMTPSLCNSCGGT